MENGHQVRFPHFRVNFSVPQSISLFSIGILFIFFGKISLLSAVYSEKNENEIKKQSSNYAMIQLLRVIVSIQLNKVSE